MDDRPSYEELLAQWKGLRGKGNIRVREVACVGAPRTMLIAEMGEAAAPAITLISGTHGDEPAGPWALLSITRDGLLDPAFSYRLWPCVNPSGYTLGTRENAEGQDINRSFDRGGKTPEARAIITANRDRRFALSLDLHEDYEARGFYCYEPQAQKKGEGGLGHAVIAAVKEEGFPLQEPEPLTYDPVEDTKRLGGMPYSTFMFRRSAQHVLTFESPRPLPWNERIAIHRAAVVRAINWCSWIGG